MRWLILWIEAAALLVFGVLLLYLGLPTFPATTSAWVVVDRLLAVLPLALVLAGMVGIAVGVAGVAVSDWRPPTRIRADAAAVIGPVGAGAALLAAILALALRASSASWVDVMWLAAWPLALGAAMVSWLALAGGTRRRRTAVLGLGLGSLTVVGMVAGFVPFLLVNPR